jgi:hypothetical protein
MEGIKEFLRDVEEGGHVKGHVRGLLHLLVGRRISRPDGTVVSSGLTWRIVAAELKQRRWDPELVRELGLDPEALAPRDRQRFWYSAIVAAHVASPQASQAADALAPLLANLGYIIGPPPGAKS